MKRIVSFAICLLSAIALFLVGCNDSGTTGKIADNTEHLTAITKTCKLTKNYQGKSFLTEGIGAATIAKYTDGDTLTVNLPQDKTSVVIRFHSVDTPESTGGVEKWGKAASLFVKNQLSKATDVVVEATAMPAEKDKYGTRYLGYIWYRQSADEDFMNLNLELVENGYSTNKGQDTSKFPYNAYFKEAENNARLIKLRYFSDLDDPLYSTDPVDVTIKDLLANIETYYNAETDSGAKVRFNACLTSLTQSKGTSPTTTFTAVEYDKENNQSYQIAVYAGYSSSNATKMELGHLYRVVGTVQSHNGQIQISGITYDAIYGETNPDYTHPIQRNYYLNFSSSESYIYNYRKTLYTDATVVSSSVENGVLTIKATARQRSTTKDASGNDVETLGDAMEFTFKVNVSEDFNNLFTTGVTFSVKGYQFEKDSGVITVIKYSDITLKKL